MLKVALANLKGRLALSVQDVLPAQEQFELALRISCVGGFLFLSTMMKTEDIIKILLQIEEKDSVAFFCGSIKSFT